MGNRETVGIITILAGVVLVIGAIRGTWSKIFKDVIIDSPPSNTITTATTNNSQTPQQPPIIPVNGGIGQTQPLVLSIPLNAPNGTAGSGQTGFSA